MAIRKSGIQGEGDKESDRKYRERTTQFVKSKRGQQEIGHAGDVSAEQAKKLRQAEEEAKLRAKGEDPQVKYQSKR